MHMHSKVAKQAWISIFLLNLFLFSPAIETDAAKSIRGDNNTPPFIQIIGSAGRRGDIVIVFILIDAESDLVDLTNIQYKKHEDTLWTAATVYGKITHLPSNPYGAQGSIIWKSDQDQADQKGYYDFTITPMDSNIGFADTLKGFWIDNLSPPPSLSLDTPEGEQSGDIQINFVIRDPYSEPHFVFEFKYSTDGGRQWFGAHFSGDHIDLPSTPEGIRHSITWHSGIDISGVDSDECMFKMALDTGVRSVTGPFHVDNNDPPNAPTYLQPPDSTELKADGVLSWKNSFDPEGDSLTYSLRIDNNQDFSSLTAIEDNIPQGISDSTGIRLSQLRQFENLLDNTIYFWKVWANDLDPGEESKVGCFAYNLFQEKPNVPLNFQVTGMNQGVIHNTSPIFTWEYGGDNDPLDNVNNTKYIIELDDDPDWSDPNLQRVETKCGQTSWQADILVDNRDYWARIRAVDASRLCSEWSSPLSFRTNAITVIRPNGDEIFSGVEEILWEAPEIKSITAKIKIEYSPDAGFSWIELANNLSNSGRYLWDTSSIRTGTRYLVRITAIDGVLLLGEDQSDRVFTIAQKTIDCQPRIFSPNGDGYHDKTEIVFHLSQTSNVTVKIYNPAGRLVKTIVESKQMFPNDRGRQIVSWDGRDYNGRLVPDNIYIVVVIIENDKGNEIRKKTVVVAKK